MPVHVCIALYRKKKYVHGMFTQCPCTKITDLDLSWAVLFDVIIVDCIFLSFTSSLSVVLLSFTLIHSQPKRVTRSF